VYPHYRELSDKEKVRKSGPQLLLDAMLTRSDRQELAFSTLHGNQNAVVIATSGITTGTNPKALLKLAIWGYALLVAAKRQRVFNASAGEYGALNTQFKLLVDCAEFSDRKVCTDSEMHSDPTVLPQEQLN
jgi:hypothetical protein